MDRRRRIGYNLLTSEKPPFDVLLDIGRICTGVNVSEESKAIQAIAKPIETLINRISDAVGTVYEPTQIRRKARAEADAKAIMTRADIDANDLQRRALRRLAEEEAKKQENIENVLDNAFPKISSEARPEELDKDWLANFFDKVKTISDEEAQKLWAELLVKETENPGGFTKRTVNTLHTLDKKDAELFEKLCGFVWNFGGAVPLVFEYNDEVYRKNGINFIGLQHLEALGLIHLAGTGRYESVGLEGRIGVNYFNTMLLLDFEGHGGVNLDKGMVMFTQIGKELFRMTKASPVEGYFEYVSGKWSKWTVGAIQVGTAP